MVYRKIVALCYVLVLTLGLGNVAYATEPAAEATTDAQEEGTEEQPLTEEQQKIQDEIDAAYAKEIQSNALTGWPQGPGTSEDAAIVMDAGTGAILYAKSIDEKHFPASITKILTALIALENGQMTDTVTMSHDSVAFMESGFSSIGLKEGNEITLEQGLYAMLLASANEAAYGVAESVGENAGHDYDWFIEQMNEKCKELGAENSNFANPHGLHDEDHYTTAQDMALISRAIFDYPEFFQICQTLEYTIPASDTVEEHIFQQKHRMLRKTNTLYYENAIGGKTGYTDEALNTLVTMADNGDMQLICVVLHAHSSIVYPDTKSLFDYAFANFHKVEVADLEQPEEIESISTDEEAYVILPDGIEYEDLDMEINPDKDLQNGTITYLYEDNPVGSSRAVLSDVYRDSVADGEDGIEKISTDDEESAKKMSPARRVMIIGASILLLVLIMLFVRSLMVIKRRKRKKRRR